ncbi:melanoma-associated antigen B16 [Fukomys damarensis]|uniref:melanoma-associated antigen B16 n=1 Tax=Fukomys damarensis TaxID=885580 RepID=UPI00053F7E8D|nr:melanoma-associated antigen B16 [Fukomys damarensis]XP_010620322.1 melanoma-associated antigen B16 [Fukomys damarensis]XP_019062734.1 melanoma-associated antigen B16 [Fukomys damarensis]
MSQYQANLEDEDLPRGSEAEGLKTAQVCSAEEEKFAASSQPLVPSSLKEAPMAETPNTSEGLQHFCLSLSNSVEAVSSQGNEQISSTRQAAAAPGNVPRSAVDEKVSFLVSFMLLKYQMKEPIRKADMLKIIVQEDEAQEDEAHFAQILLRACERMEMIFGLDVKEVDPISHCYGVFIKLGLTYDGMRSGEEGMPKTGLLMLVLGVIFMKGNRAPEEEMWKALNLAGMYSGKNHFLFGEPGKVITKEFVQEKYVEYRLVANSDPPQYEFLWGPRAYAETSKMKVLEFLAKVLGVDPGHFLSQYAEALLEDVERALASVQVISHLIRQRLC